MTRPLFSSWDQLFMSLAFFIAMKSKDRSTKVGAVIVDDKRRIVSMGYNGFPRGVKDDVPSRHRRPLKYLWMVHAENNALKNANKPTEGCILYTPWIPCAPCAGQIVQSGIREVVHYHSIDEGFGSQMTEIVGCHDWLTSIKEAKKMFREARVKLRSYDGDLVTEIVQVCGEKASRPCRRRRT